MKHHYSVFYSHKDGTVELLNLKICLQSRITIG